jgi:hypothetical protein
MGNAAAGQAALWFSALNKPAVAVLLRSAFLRFHLRWLLHRHSRFLLLHHAAICAHRLPLLSSWMVLFSSLHCCSPLSAAPPRCTSGFRSACWFYALSLFPAIFSLSHSLLVYMAAATRVCRRTRAADVNAAAARRRHSITPSNIWVRRMANSYKRRACAG